MWGGKCVFPQDGLRAYMTWKIELAALAITAAGVGGYLYEGDLFAEVPVTYHEEFTEADFHAFDRDFLMAGESCEIGLKASGICLPEFDMDRNLVAGEKFPEDLPALSAGMRILLALDSKQTNLQTIRYGQTLVLMERSTKEVRDVMRLDAPTFADARTPELRGAPVSVAAN